MSFSIIDKELLFYISLKHPRLLDSFPHKIRYTFNGKEVSNSSKEIAVIQHDSSYSLELRTFVKDKEILASIYSSIALETSSSEWNELIGSILMTHEAKEKEYQKEKSKFSFFGLFKNN